VAPSGTTTSASGARTFNSSRVSSANSSERVATSPPCRLRYEILPFGTRGRPAIDDFRGIFGVTVTPFTDDGARVDDDRLADLVGRLLDDGIDHLVPNGNTGEYHALTADERRRVVETTVAAAAGRARVILAGVGGAVSDAAAAAEHAARAGATAVMAHYPVHPHVTQEGFLAYLAAVAERSPLPLVPYLKTPLDEDGARRLVDIPGVVAVKWGLNDLPGFGRAVAVTQGSHVQWICGTAELWAPFFYAVGAVGFTSGLVNVTAGPSKALLDALERGDRAATLECWNAIRPFEQLRTRRSDGWNVAIVKAAMRLVGRPAGPVRPPSSPVGEAEEREISALLAAWGMARTPVAGR
jgi:4-hydroxy-tetrahydrodipicolinate synthase